MQPVDGLHAGGAVGDVLLDEVFRAHGVRRIGEPLACDAVPGLGRLLIGQDDANPDRTLRLDFRREKEMRVSEEGGEGGEEDEMGLACPVSLRNWRKFSSFIDLSNIALPPQSSS